MDAEWVRWVGAIALGVIAYFAQRWVSAVLEVQREKEEALQKELKRLSKNYHDLVEYTREQGMLVARLCERLDVVGHRHFRGVEDISRNDPGVIEE